MVYSRNHLTPKQNWLDKLGGRTEEDIFIIDGKEYIELDGYPGGICQVPEFFTSSVDKIKKK